MNAVGTFQHDLPALFVGVALCTIAIGLFAFGLLGRRIASMDLPTAGAFAATYGFRLIIRTTSITMMLGNPDWLPYVQSAFQYLVPIPGAILFARFFGERLHRFNRLFVIIFTLNALVAIPYEVFTRQPRAGFPLDNASVLGFLVLYLVNIIMPAPEKSQDWRILRVATGVFGCYVINEHYHFVQLPFGLSTEPVGFLVFLGTIVFTLIRHTVRTQMRVSSVDGELAAARRIQMSIIPKRPPEVRGLDLAAVYTPASEVAGDFFDFLVLGDRRLGILIADVSGHGVPAALVASMLKVALYSQTAFAGEPTRLLHELNAFFCGKLERQFITASYALIDSATGTVRVANAGHPPPVIVRADRSVEELAADGVLIGRFRDARFGEKTASMHSGDALMLYTDGIPEALDAAQRMWGEARLREAAASAVSEAASVIVQRVLDRLRSWSAVPADDVTLVVAKQLSA